MKILIIQTAFTGDVVLATPLIEKLKNADKNNIVDFLVRKGNESLLFNNPNVNKILIFDKKEKKYRNLVNLIKEIRAESYDYVINVQRFFTTGLITVFSGAKVTIGFRKNPLSFLFKKTIKHQISKNNELIHEISRNLSLLEEIADTKLIRPVLYPSESDFQAVFTKEKYICIAPSSVWFTKQFPMENWCKLILKLVPKYKIFLIGASGDIPLCEEIRCKTDAEKVEIYAGKLSFLQSAALIKNAKMTFTNDSAPLHFASAMNAPVTAFFCSTVPEFGFGPLSDVSIIAQTDKKLECRPCGLHGKKKCPKQHFYCSDIEIDKFIGATID
jgi:heptosyltransferase-2